MQVMHAPTTAGSSYKGQLAYDLRDTVVHTVPKYNVPNTLVIYITTYRTPWYTLRVLHTVPVPKCNVPNTLVIVQHIAMSSPAQTLIFL